MAFFTISSTASDGYNDLSEIANNLSGITYGKGALMDGNKERLLGEILAQGGWTMVPLYACSIVALAVSIRKLIEYRALHLSDLSWFEEALNLIRLGDFNAVSGACNHRSHPAARVVCAAAKALTERPELAESEARRVAILEIQKLEKNLSLLSFIAQIAPLLGLLGTVFGMIKMFMDLQEAGNSSINLSDLSSGIWEALVTTAAGLTIAVPTLAIHDYLSSRLDNVRLHLGDIIQSIFYVAPRNQAKPEVTNGF
ncbi:MotA/TolQ/ExbB proton channel family protein [Nitrosomonas communis]|nr:MotA/TolQ/ExbB proton channel family protein [Nitrosomonas communis]